MTRKVGLTGGIATGKSTVSKYLREKGIAVIDADQAARAVVEVGGWAYKPLRKHFGDAFFFADGSLDRKKLGTVVFHDPNELLVLNSLLHPAIYQWMQEQTEAAIEEGAALLVYDVPLLFETGFDQKVEEVVVVYTTKEQQIERLMKRDGLSKQEALSRIKSQLPIEEKMKRADTLIDNRKDLTYTRQQVDEWVAELQKQSQ